MASALLFGMVVHASTALLPQTFAPPVRLEAGGRPIDVAVGHAAPFACDWDGDGVRDLLVGEFGDEKAGNLWLHRNEGTNEAPRLAAGVKVEAGGEDARVPTG